MMLTNPRAERVRRYAEYAQAKAQRRYGKFLIEGPQAVREAIRYRPDAVEDVIICADEEYSHNAQSAQNAHHAATLVQDIQNSTAVLAALREEALSQGLYVHDASSAVMHAISAQAQGIVAIGSLEAMRTSCNALDKIFVQAALRRFAALWQVRDPGNAGTVIRAADAAGCAAVLLVDHSVSPFNPKVVRSTAGSLFHLPVVALSTQELLAWARAHALCLVAADVYGTERHKPTLLSDVTSNALQAPSVMLFGNEARGLPEAVLDEADEIVKIPLFGAAESLNLATSAAIMLFHYAMGAHSASAPESGFMSSHTGKI